MVVTKLNKQKFRSGLELLHVMLWRHCDWKGAKWTM